MCQEGMYPIIFLHREDIAAAMGDDFADQLSEQELRVIARKMGENYTTTGGYWQDLRTFTDPSA